MNENIRNRFDVLIKKTYYIHKRYGVESTFALLYHKEPLSIVELSKYIRISDHIIQIDENHYFIIFQFISAEKAYKASQNITYKLDNHFGSEEKCYMAIDKLDTTITSQNVLRRLKLIVEYAIKNRCVRVETEEVLDR